MLIKLAIWYLRKRKVSTLIGFVIFGGSIQASNKRASLHDSTLMHVDYYDRDGTKIFIPEGEFSLKTRSRK